MKTIIVTGATNGIGLEACVTFAREGHRVIMVGRDEKRTKAALEQIKRRAGGGTLEYALCNFEKQASVRALAEDLRRRCEKIDVLVNNAGTVFDKRAMTEDGIEATFAVNHLGPFLLTNLLLDVIKRSAPARIVNVASIGHKRGTMNFDDLFFERGYGIMNAYSRSKLGNVLFTLALSKRLAGSGVTTNSLHPGGVATNIWSGAPKWSQPILAVLKALFMITPEEGGKTITYLATSAEVETSTGLYFEKNRPTPASRLGQDTALAEKLWEKSAQLVKLN